MQDARLTCSAQPGQPSVTLEHRWRRRRGAHAPSKSGSETQLKTQYSARSAKARSVALVSACGEDMGVEWLLSRVPAEMQKPPTVAIHESKMVMLGPAKRRVQKHVVPK